MTANDVTDFVAKHSGKLCLVGQLVKQTLGDKDLAPGQGEGVDRLRIVEQVKVKVIDVRTLAGVASLDNPLADFGDQAGPAVGRRINRPSHFPGHLRCGLQSEGLFLGHRHRDALLLARHRIDLGVCEIPDQGHQSDDHRDHDPKIRAAPLTRAVAK